MKNYFLLFLFLLCSTLFSQSQIKITNGLAIQTNPPGRRSLSQVDPVEYMIVRGIWSEPKSNSSLNINDTIANWFKVDADEDGWLKDEKLNGAYLYYKLESEEDKIMILEGHGYYNVIINGEPRIGNVYGNKDEYESWEPNFNISYLPVQIKKGKNEFLFQVSYGSMKAVLHEVNSVASLNVNDNTLPDVFKNKIFKDFGGMIVINSQNKTLKNAKIKATSSNGEITITDVPNIIPLSIRKVKFDFSGNANNSDKEILKAQLILDDKVLDEKEISLRCVNELDAYKQTFISEIDGSVQYYAVRPSLSDENNQALFLSTHGARVEAFNQAASYANKNWGNIVCPTNRRPYGFNWEDIGRLDALEVLKIAKQKFNPDENRIYLTGHSMGGHGAWYLGVIYPDQFAAIGPSAGWISLWSYRFDGLEENFTDIQKLYTKAAKQSDTYSLAHNYSQLGIYIVHGDADSVVSPSQAKSMMRKLSEFHSDYDFHFEPGKEHWWDVDTIKPGNDCVDWTPMFDYFARHSRPLNRIKKINFTTANPGISAKNYWVKIEQQENQFEFSNIDIEFIPEINNFRVNTKNIKTFSVNLNDLNLRKDIKIKFYIDNFNVNSIVADSIVYLIKENNEWKLSFEFNKNEKNPERYGSFKDLFKNNLVLVYGTEGTAKENNELLAKVRYDSEMFWYVGNGSFEIIPDYEFRTEDYKDNNILLYGNSNQNSAYDKLLKNYPIDINSSAIKIGNQNISDSDLSIYSVFPKKNSVENLVGIIAGTGLEGIRLSYLRPFLKPGSAFPDFVIFNSKILKHQNEGISSLGYFSLDWYLEKGEYLVD